MHRDFVVKFTIFVAISLGATIFLWYGIQDAILEITANPNTSAEEQIQHIDRQAPSGAALPQKGEEPANSFDWKIYRNEKYGYEFRYPKNWNVEESSNSVSTVRSWVRSKKEYDDPFRDMQIVVYPSRREWPNFDRDINLGRKEDWGSISTNGIQVYEYRELADYGISYKIITFQRGDILYALTLYEKAADLDVFNKIISTFKILKTFSFDWEGKIPEIRKVIGLEFTGVHIEETNKISIIEQADLTADGVPEALIDFGTGGAYTHYLTLVIMENGKPVPAKFKEPEGNASPHMFISGASLTHGASTEILPEFHIIYDGSWERRVDNFLACSVKAYQYNFSTKVFEFNTKSSEEIKTSFCERIKLENS